MGMFDSVHFITGGHRVRCAAGHEQRDFQTKDFGCDLTDYRVAGERPRIFESCVGVAEIHDVSGSGNLKVTTVREYAPMTHSGEVTIYTFCEECNPVVYEIERFGRAEIDSALPWVEYVLTVRDGVVTKIAPSRVESRTDLADSLVALGRRVLPDDDRVAAREIEQHRTARGESDG